MYIQIALLHENPNVWEGVGAVLCISGAVAISYQRWAAKRALAAGGSKVVSGDEEGGVSVSVSDSGSDDVDTVVSMSEVSVL